MNNKSVMIQELHRRDWELAVHPNKSPGEWVHAANNIVGRECPSKLQLSFNLTDFGLTVFQESEMVGYFSFKLFKDPFQIIAAVPFDVPPLYEVKYS